MSKLHLIEEHCHCGYKVEFDFNWSEFNPDRQYVARLIFQDEGLGCTYFRWVDPERNQWEK